MNGGTRLSYYNYTIEVKILQIYFVDSVIFILHLNANLFNIICLLIYIYIFIYLCIYSFIYLFIYLFIFIYYLGINFIFL